MFLLSSTAARPLYPFRFRLARSISSIDAFERAKAPPLSPKRTSDLRQWAAAFRTRKLDKSIDGCDVRFDRAGGAGGQNVNKVATKATVRITLKEAATTWLHPELVGPLRKTPYYAANSDSLVCTGSAQRQQSQNLAECFDKIQSLILETVKPLTPAEQTDQSKERIEELKAKARLRMRERKTRASQKTQSRKVGRYD